MTFGNPSGARRLFINSAARLAAMGIVAPWAGQALAAHPRARELSFEHTHTRERLSVVYAVGHEYLPASLARLNHFLRDHYSGQIGHMDPRLFDQLFNVRQALGSTRAFEVISGYRCQDTNERLRTTRGGGVARRSLHMDGMAIDVRLIGAELLEVRDAALSLKAGGVGFYARERFVHLDTGRARSW